MDLHPFIHSIISAIYEDVAPIAVAIFVPYACAKLVQILRSAAARAHIELDSRVEAQVRYVVEKWVKFAEASPATGTTKLAVVLDGVTKELPDVDADAAHVVVEDVLVGLSMGPTAKQGITVHAGAPVTLTPTIEVAGGVVKDTGKGAF